MSTTELTQNVYDAYMGVRKGRNADECRATLRKLREAHGDAAFEAAKIRALAYDVKRNG